MILFKICWCIDAIATLVFVYFFFIVLADGTIGEKNMGLWLLILSVVASIMIGSIWLRLHGHPAIALTILLVLAIPAVIFALYFGIAIASNARWN